jgi:hypothetical protein
MHALLTSTDYLISVAGLDGNSIFHFRPGHKESSLAQACSIGLVMGTSRIGGPSRASIKL